MKKSIALTLVVAVFSLAFGHHVRASEVGKSKKFGVGGILGEPSGFSMKYYFNKNHAIDFAAGFYWWYDPAISVHADYLFHIYLPHPEPFELPLHFGVGPMLIVWFEDDCHYYWGHHDRHCDPDSKYRSWVGFGVRVPIGVSFLFNKYPLEAFAEIVPSVGFFPWPGFFLSGAIGARYYF